MYFMPNLGLPPGSARFVRLCTCQSQPLLGTTSVRNEQSVSGACRTRRDLPGPFWRLGSRVRGGRGRYVSTVTVKLPRRLARFNRVVTNRIQGVYAWFLPPWAVICHRGRRSGRTYRTPVMALRRGPTVAIAALYGEESDWVRNLLAVGGGQLVRAGRTYELVAPWLVHATERDTAPAAARPLLRIADAVLVAEVRGPTGPYGRGPGAGA